MLISDNNNKVLVPNFWGHVWILNRLVSRSQISDHN